VREDVLSEAEVSFAGVFFCFFFGQAKKKIENHYTISIKQSLAVFNCNLKELSTFKSFKMLLHSFILWQLFFY